jgi:Cytochrome P450
MPDTVLWNSPQAYNDIYNLKANVQKSKTYSAWVRNESDMNTLSTTDVALHAKKRRLLNQVFTEKSVRAAGAYVAKHIDRWNDLLVSGHGEEWSDSLNLADSTDSLVFDILGDLCFGRSFDIKEPGDNPLKIIPHAIVEYMQFMYPVIGLFPRSQQMLIFSRLPDPLSWISSCGSNLVVSTDCSSL